tara:strand:+ start:113266 stop:116715 length:3450 start_codon:yes stop_codon:yes gene_type:complete
MITSASQTTLTPLTLAQLDPKNAANIYSLLVIIGLVENSVDNSVSTREITAYQSLPALAQANLKQAAIKSVESFVASGQNKDSLQTLLELMTTSLLAKENNIDNWISLLSSNTITKLSIASPIVGKKLIQAQIKKLSPDQLQWLLLVLASGQLVTKIQLDNQMLTAPNPKEPGFDICCQLLALAQGQDSANQEMQICVQARLGELGGIGVQKQQAAEQTIFNFESSKMQSKFYEHAHHSIHWIDGHDDDIAARLQEWRTNELAWCLYVISTGTQPAESTIENASTYLLKLTQLSQTYSRGQVIHVLEKKLLSQGHTKTSDDIKLYFEEQIAKLESNSKKWLLLELTFKNFPQIPELGVTTPTDEQLAICNKLEKSAYGCSALWNNLYNNLLQGLGPELQEVLPYIPGLIHSIIGQLPDECKLWLAVAVASNTIQPSYDINDAHFSAELGHTTLRQMLPEDIVRHFQFLAKSSPLMHGLIQSVLSQAEDNPEYEQKFSAVPLYEKHLVNKKLNNLDNNTLCWLLYSLTFNTILSKSIDINKDIHIKVPSNRLKDHAHIILAQAHNSPSSRLAYIKGIHNKLEPNQVAAFETLSGHYIQRVIESLTAEQQTWLYISLQRNEVGHHQLSFDTVYAYPKEKQQQISKVLYLISLHPMLKERAAQVLTTQNESLKDIHIPLIETLGLVSTQMLKPGEFADLMNLEADKAETLALVILQQLPEIAQVWLAASLEKGVIDTQSLLMLMVQAKIQPQEIFPILMALPNIILLALKWPNIKTGIIQACDGNPDNIQPLQAVQLDNMPLGDYTFAALCDVLSIQAEHLEVLSTTQCGLSDKALMSFYHNLYGLSAIKSLNVGGNNITAEGYKLLLNHPGTYENPTQLITAFSSLWREISQPDSLSYLCAHYLVQQALIDPGQTVDTLQFFRPQEALDKLALADLLLSEAKKNPTLHELLSTFVTQVPLSVQYIQLAHAALQSHNQEFILNTLSAVIETIQNSELKNWLRESLETGTIQLPVVGSQQFTTVFGEPLNQSDIMLAIQASSLLLGSNLSTKNKVHALLGGNSKILLPSQISFSSEGYEIPENLKCLLTLGRQCLEVATPNTEQHTSDMGELDLKPQNTLLFQAEQRANSAQLSSSSDQILNESRKKSLSHSI